MGMGEVTNAYISIENVGTGDATNVCAELQASDVGRRHPDQSWCIQYLLPSKQVYQTLTADTELRTGTSINVVVTCNEGERVETGRGSCPEIEPRLRNFILERVGISTDF